MMLISALAAAGCAGSSSHAVSVGPPALVSLVRPGVQVEPVVVAPAPRPAPSFRIIPKTDWTPDAPIASRLAPMGKVTRLTIHHAGMDRGEECSVEAVKTELCKIRNSHLARMRAGDIGYHYIIDFNGRVWEGRSVKYQGAHAGNSGANKGNIGIVLMGNFEIQSPSAAQVSQLRALTDYIMSKYSIPPSQIFTHCEIKAMYGLGTTDCPGRYLQTKVDEMRILIAEAGTE